MARGTKLRAASAGLVWLSFVLQTVPREVLACLQGNFFLAKRTLLQIYPDISGLLTPYKIVIDLEVCFFICILIIVKDSILVGL